VATLDLQAMLRVWLHVIAKRLGVEKP